MTDFFSAILVVKKMRPAHLLAHALAGAGLFLVLTPRPVWSGAWWLVLVAAVAALAPDLDTVAGIPHRTATHSVFAIALVWWLSHTLTPAPLAAAIFWGYASHVLVDVLHGQGVGIFSPVTTEHVQVAAMSVTAVAVIAGLVLWAGLKSDAPLYHLMHTATPTPAPTPAAIAGWPSCVPASGAVRVNVVRVIDGDTFIAKWPDGHTDTVRLLGVNAPEIAHPQYGKPDDEPGGQEATRWLTSRLSPADIYIYAERGRDRYGRLLAYVIADGHLLNAELLRVGLARLYMERGLLCETELASAAANAQLAATGVWSAPTPTPTLTPTPTATPGYDYQAALLRLQAERVALQVTAVCATATARPWRFNRAWLDWQLARLTLDESEAWLRYQAWLQAHPPTATPTPMPAMHPDFP